MYGVPRFNQFWLEVLHILNVSHSKSFTGDQLNFRTFRAKLSWLYINSQQNTISDLTYKPKTRQS